MYTGDPSTTVSPVTERVQTTTNSKTGAALSRYQVGQAAEDAIFIGIDNEGRVLMNDLTKEKEDGD